MAAPLWPRPKPPHPAQRDACPLHAGRKSGKCMPRPPLLRRRVLLAGIRLDQAGINGHARAADETCGDAPRHRRPEPMAAQVAGAETPRAVLGQVASPGTWPFRPRRQNQRYARRKCTPSHRRRSDRMSKQQPTSSIRSFEATDGRPVRLQNPKKARGYPPNPPRSTHPSIERRR